MGTELGSDILVGTNQWTGIDSQSLCFRHSHMFEDVAKHPIFNNARQTIDRLRGENGTDFAIRYD